MNITKYIPYKIEIKSLYWVKQEKEIINDFKTLFALIDEDEYLKARIVLSQLEQKWFYVGNYDAPKWFKDTHMPTFANAESMLNFLQTNYDDEEL